MRKRIRESHNKPKQDFTFLGEKKASLLVETSDKEEYIEGYKWSTGGGI